MFFNSSDSFHTSPQPSYNGFVPPAFSNGVVFGTDTTGRTVVVSHLASTSQEALNADMAELRSRLAHHNWYYRYHENLETFTAGYRNEQAILAIIKRRGGVFETIWETERHRHLVTN